MVVYVQKVGDQFVLPAHAVDELELSDGVAVEIHRVGTGNKPASRFASAEEVLKVHREMEPEYAPAYKKLAK